MKTVREVACKLNVSRQTVYKKINKTYKKDLQGHLHKKNGCLLIDDDGFRIIKDSMDETSSVDSIGADRCLQGLTTADNLGVDKCLQVFTTVDNLGVDKGLHKENNGTANPGNPGKEAFTGVDSLGVDRCLQGLTTADKYHNNCYLDMLIQSNDNLISELKQRVNDLEKRIDYNQRIINSQQETINRQQETNSKQIEALQLLLAREQEKNNIFINRASQSIERIIGETGETCLNQNHDSADKDKGIIVRIIYKLFGIKRTPR